LKTHDNQPSLAERLRAKIAREDAITFRDWMAAALYDEREGYYRRHDLMRWGRAGDYRTSPERTPLFAATFARYFASLHEQLGSPARWTIYEAGAGSGDFACVALRTLARDHAEVFRATRYVIDEIGEDARRVAASKLAPFAEQVEFRRFAESIGDVAHDGIVFSNELFDALPLHCVRMSGGRLRELCVGLDADGNFEWIEREPSTPRLVEHFARFGVELSEGQCAEVNLAAEDFVRRFASLITRGFVVTVDYGATAEELYDVRLRPRGSLRAFRAHRLSDDLLASPGEQDITATVNWSQLIRAGTEAGLETVLLERQDKFLLNAGFVEQLEAMSARAAGEGERASLRVAAREMILPGGMSESFQVLVQKK
jgi:SAM-dependent MidA family methyltransferase